MGSIQVVAGSTIVTPASMCSRLIRSRSEAPAAASSTRVLTPSVSAGSGATKTPTPTARGHDTAHGIGEVELALRVGRRELVERRPERLRAEHVDGRVRLADRELLRARVRGLDDGDEVALLVADDAAVAADLVGHEREDGGRRAGGSMGVDERGEELRRQERCVAREDEHLVRVPDRLARRANGVARPERTLLHRDRQPVERVGGVRRGDDDERLGAERLGGRDDPVDHPPPEDRVEMLRDRGAHTRPEPSGHHDCSESRRHHE